MPRKVLVPARAALRFAQRAAGERGPAQRDDVGCCEFLQMTPLITASDEPL